MNAYRILMLIMEAIVITYMVGCVWFFIVNNFNTAEDIERRLTFITKYDLDKMHDDLYKRVMISCYFSIATLTTIGYGDLAPVSTRERIFGIIIEICGMIFFSNIMGNFISIITTYHKRMGIRDYSSETNNWLTLLTRFTQN